MGLVYQRIRIANAARPELEEVDAKALVDSRAIDLCIPKHVVNQLKLQVLEQREVTTADGNKQVVDYVGPILVEVFGRKAYTGALVMGDTVLLGAIPMESMDLLIDPRRQVLIPNPENPNIPGAMAMGVRHARKAAE
ncbi:MAG: clan AA aspartic protease [Novosphingobium sp. 32-60-15]|uniref:clan AA aspartic protease n=1 Tax=unclassified Novosphingobium TaxID=2644732 RepID=UPI000BC65CBC|nr:MULTISPECIES: clan AA aspartic protease [unclassified Novosphingobium]OYX64875.1 MAG: clan AA aspartic protease [Novosphingobium sp. 32-60-15]